VVESDEMAGLAFVVMIKWPQETQDA